MLPEALLLHGRKKFSNHYNTAPPFPQAPQKRRARKNTNPKPEASGLRGGTDVTEWMTSFFASQKKTSERSEIRPDVVREMGLEPTRL